MVLNHKVIQFLKINLGNMNSYYLYLNTMLPPYMLKSPGLQPNLSNRWKQVTKSIFTRYPADESRSGHWPTCDLLALHSATPVSLPHP